MFWERASCFRILELTAAICVTCDESDFPFALLKMAAEISSQARIDRTHCHKTWECLQFKATLFFKRPFCKSNHYIFNLPLASLVEKPLLKTKRTFSLYTNTILTYYIGFPFKPVYLVKNNHEPTCGVQLKRQSNDAETVELYKGRFHDKRKMHSRSLFWLLNSWE